MASNDWTDELRAEVVEAYKSSNPTPENTVEIVKDLAEEYEKTPNGIRMVLLRSGVYVNTAASTPSGKAKEGATKSTRVSKADALDGLRALIEARGKEVDDSIVDKLTGKAALYLTSVFSDDE